MSDMNLNMVDAVFLRKAAEYVARAKLIMRGYEVATLEAQSIGDLLVKIGSEWKIVQVKSGTQILASGNLTISLTRNRINKKETVRKTYTADECDYFILVNEDFECWMFPFEVLKGKLSVVPVRYPEYKI